MRHRRLTPEKTPKITWYIRGSGPRPSSERANSHPRHALRCGSLLAEDVAKTATSCVPACRPGYWEDAVPRPWEVFHASCLVKATQQYQ